MADSTTDKQQAKPQVKADADAPAQGDAEPQAGPERPIGAADAQDAETQDTEGETHAQQGKRQSQPGPDGQPDAEQLAAERQAEPEGDAASPAERHRLVVALAGVAIVAVVLALAVVAVAQWRRADHLHHTEAVRHDVANTAGRFGQALLSYDFNDLTASRNRVLALATSSLSQNYTTAFTNGLDATITQLKARASATVRNVYLDDINGDRTQAVVTLDSQVNSTGGSRQTVGSYLQLSMLRQAGRWKVDQVIPLVAVPSGPGH